MGGGHKKKKKRKTIDQRFKAASEAAFGSRTPMRQKAEAQQVFLFPFGIPTHCVCVRACAEMHLMLQTKAW